MAASKNPLWVDAFYSTTCQLKSDYGVVLLALEDLAGDGSDRLVVLLIGQPSLLKVLYGADLVAQITLPEVAVALCIFYLDASCAGSTY